MIKYIGSKRVFVDQIVSLAASLPGISSVCDLFAGTTRVGQAFKKAGYSVHSNDTASYSRVFGNTYIATNPNNLDLNRLKAVISEINQLSPREGYITKTFCTDSRFFQAKNGMRIDAALDYLRERRLPEPYESIVLTSLIEAADKVDSTTGVQMAYLKKWSARSFKDLHLEIPNLIPGSGAVSQVDANELVKQFKFDLVYIDPPYNQHSYHSNYHIWETVARMDTPEVYGIAKKRIDCKTEKSPYNSKREYVDVFKDLINSVQARHLIVSFNNEGYWSKLDLENVLGGFGYTATLELQHRRYVGALIGIHNLKGEKVGTVSHTKNIEYLFIASKEQHSIDRLTSIQSAKPIQSVLI